MNKRYQGIMQEISKLNTEVKEIFDAAGDDALDSATTQKVKDNNKRIEELEHQAKDLLDQIEMRNAADRRSAQDNQIVNGLGVGAGADGGKKDKEARGGTVGHQVITNEEFKSFLDLVSRGGSVTRAQFKNSPAVNLKTLITSAANSAGALMQADNIGLVDQGVYQRPLTLRDLITTGVTGSDQVEFVRVTGATNNASPVAEATASSNGSGAKPESALNLEKDTESVKTIAHWIPATRRALADAPQIRTLIDNFLVYGLNEEVEDQMVRGDGTGDNFLGILNTPGIQTQTFSTDVLQTARKARTKVRLSPGRATPSAYVMHPLDWEALDLLQDNEARYFFGGPSVIGNARLWGLPVVESESVPQGDPLVADWRWAVLWDREAAQIMVSDSHSDFFVRNLIAILAELRAAFTVLRPGAFVEFATS